MRLFVQAFRPLAQGFHRLLDLPLVRLAQDCVQNFLDPHHRLPAFPILLGGDPAPPGGRE
jgi:hypothetical protein